MIRSPWTLALAAAALFGFFGRSAQADVITHPVYDPLDGNEVDVEASGNPFTLAQWQSRVSEAFGRGVGGVLNFDDSDDIAEISQVDTFSATFGTIRPKTIVFDNGLAGSNDWEAVTGASGRAGISQDRYLTAISTGSDPSNRNDYSIDFGAITGGDPGESVVEAALTLLSRETSGQFSNVTVTALFSDSTTDQRVFDLLNNTTSGRDDTFLVFQAPEGESIENILVNLPGGSFTSVDDLAFITNGTPVPEPSTMGLAALGLIALALVGWRRRRR